MKDGAFAFNSLHAWEPRTLGQPATILIERFQLGFHAAIPFHQPEALAKAHRDNRQPPSLALQAGISIVVFCSVIKLPVALFSGASHLQIGPVDRGELGWTRNHQVGIRLQLGQMGRECSLPVKPWQLPMIL